MSCKWSHCIFLNLLRIWGQRIDLKRDFCDLFPRSILCWPRIELFFCWKYIGEKNEEKEKEMKQEYGYICDWIKKRLGDKVSSVQLSNRLSTSPCVLVSGKFGWSANMERYYDCLLFAYVISYLPAVPFYWLIFTCRLMKAQTMGDASSLEFMRSRRIFEINPQHPIIKTLNVRDFVGWGILLLETCA